MIATFAKLLRYGRPQRGRLVLVACLSLLDMGLNAQLSLSFKYLIDNASPGKDSSTLLWIIGALCISVLVVSVAGWWRDKVYAALTSEMVAGLRANLFHHIQQLSARFYSNTAAADVLTRFSTDLIDVERTMLNAVPWAVMPALDALLAVGLVIWLDWRLALFALLSIPISMAVPKRLSNPVTEASAMRRQNDTELQNFVGESIQAHTLVRAFGLAENFSKRFQVQNQSSKEAGSRFGLLMLTMERSATVSTQVLQVLVMAVGGFLVYRGEMSLGTFAAFQAIFLSLTQAISTLAQFLPQITQAGASLTHVEDLFAEQPQVRDAEHPGSLAPLAKEVEFRNLSFGYDGTRMNLDRVSFRVPAGASVAFVGPSGSGKSTILSLLLRFYDPAAGAVLLDGIDIRNVSQQSLRQQMAVVFQDNLVLRGSIRQNVQIARENATDEEIEAALRDAGLPDLPLDMAVAPGRLSGGQRQRLGIARALLRDPRILILDEATSALDSATEATINATINRVSKGRTVFAVTHRLGSAIHADQIFFLDKGRIVENGSHAELLALNGAYANLWNKQSGFEMSADGDRASITPDRLRSIPILAGLDETVLPELARAFVTETGSKDQYIFHEGDVAGKFYILVRGSVEVLKATPEGVERRVEVLQDGDFFGEQAMLLNAPRSSSVRCLGECTLLVLSGDSFRGLMGRAPELRWKLREAATIGQYRNEEVAAGTVLPWSRFRHDLLTPVNHMVGYAELLEEELQEAGQEEASIDAGSIRVAARAIQSLVDRLIPTGRTPAADALSVLRVETEPILHSIEMAAEAVREYQQNLSDLVKIQTAAARFREILNDPDREMVLPHALPDVKFALGSENGGGARHLLVVDDNSLSRDLLCRKLEREGYRVSSAAGGQAALDMVASQRASFDLVLLDVLMPGVDGIEVLRRWRKDGTLAYLPVIVTSAMDEVNSAVRCIELGAEDYLTKPFDPALLNARIASCIAKKGAPEPI